MTFLQQYHLNISTLAPVHIGCNETYEPSNYIIEGDALYEFSPFEAMEVLDSKERQRLHNIVKAKPNEELLKKVQGFFYSNRQALLSISQHFLPVANGVADLYAKRIGKIANQERKGKGVINQLEIERTAYNPTNHQAIFPGSSIKGAIRTALLDAINQGQRVMRGERSHNLHLQQCLFQYQMGTIHKDPMRLISIADARWQAGDMPNTEVLFAVNRRKKHTMKDGRLLESRAEQDGLYQLLECLPATQYRCLQTTLNIQQVNGLNGSEEKLPAKALRWLIKDIAAACNAFYKPLLEKELSLLKQLNYADPEWIARIQQALTLTENNQAFLLRLGRHSGAEAVTLNGVRSIRIMRGKEKPEFAEAPKTIWLASSEQASKAGMSSFGWVLIEIDAQGDTVLKDSFQASRDRLIAWQQEKLAAQAKQQAIIQKQREEQQRKDAEAKAAAEREAEEKRKQQEALEQAKSSMSELAGEFFELAETKGWKTDKNAFTTPPIIESWVEKQQESQDEDLKNQLLELLEIHFKGICNNPDKVKGKKKKPVYPSRASSAVKVLLNMG